MLVCNFFYAGLTDHNKQLLTCIMDEKVQILFNADLGLCIRLLGTERVVLTALL